MISQDGSYQKPDGTTCDGIGLKLDHDKLGITPTFELSHQLARLFQDNKHLLQQHLPNVERRLRECRHEYARVADWKRHTLSYAFLVQVYGNQNCNLKALEAALAKERDPRMRDMLRFHGGALAYMQERLDAVNKDVISQWWFILWDE